MENLNDYSFYVNMSYIAAFVPIAMFTIFSVRKYQNIKNVQK